MQYHTLSLLEAGHTVSLVGYEGEDLIPDLSLPREDLNVIRFRVPSPKTLQKSLPIYLLWRIVNLSLYLLYALFISVPSGRKEMVDCVLVQNPPAMPLLAIAYMYCRVIGFFSGHRPSLVIDWHNLGYSMLPNAFFAKIARLYEKTLAPLSDRHFCVTSAMKSFLHDHFKIPEAEIEVLYDCPPDMFQPLSTAEQHQVLRSIESKIFSACPRSWYSNLKTPEESLFTVKMESGDCAPRRGRPALVTSSTSWTPDEDFGQLIDALVSLDSIIRRQQSSLRVLVIVTGKGPQKSLYEAKISKLRLENVVIQTLWLQPVDYPRLLACADLGVSLHTSTSNLDLPMKILDLFGCQVPVCARNFLCLSELVQDDKNGRIFESCDELADHLWFLLRPLGEETSNGLAPHSYGDLDRYSRSLQGRKRWRENWNENARMVFEATPYLR